MKDQKTDPEVVARVRRLIEKTGLTREALAEKVGVSTHAIYDYLAGKYYPKLNTYLKIEELATE